MCLCTVVCVYLRLRYLTLIISTDGILRMAAQFFISLCWLFWAVMYSFLFYLFCKFNSILVTNKVVAAVVVVASLLKLVYINKEPKLMV